MGVQIVTDSVSDLPEEIVLEYGLHIVPLTVSFGEETGGELMDPDDFYERMVVSDPLPTTAAPSVEDYAAVYRDILETGDSAVVVTLSGKLSATYDVAVRAIESVGGAGRITVVDSTRATIAEGFVAISAARVAREGASRSEVAEAARKSVSRIGFLAAFDTMEYLRRGGRIGAAKALLGSVLKIHPLVAISEGSIVPYGRARSRSQAMDSLVEFVNSFRSVEMMGIEHTACAEDATLLRRRLSESFPEARILESRATPVIGTHTGPGLLVVSVLGDPRSVVR